MEKSMKAYFKVRSREEEIKVTVGYDLGGLNAFSGNHSRRGYYIYVQPVTRTGLSESCTLFDGFKKCLKEVSKQSKKAKIEAIEMARAELRTLAEEMATRKGWTLADDNPEIKED